MKKAVFLANKPICLNNMSKKLNKGFLNEFLKKGNSVGAVAPSSKQLVNKMLKPVNFKDVKCIVELGPGTGPITVELLKKMPKDSLLLVFEINKEFCEILTQNIKDKRMKIISDSAENIDIYLKQYGIEKPDYIISSLPLTIIPKKVVENILLKAKSCLKEQGAYIQFQYSLNAYRKLKRLFSKVQLNFTAANFPPAFIFICQN